jgi:predicted tellurium resistance membrane protein TerC
MKMMVDSIVSQITNWLSESLTGDWVAFIVSLFPILELRGGLIAASILGVPLGRAFLLCFIGNILPIPLILVCIRRFINWCKKTKLLRWFAEWLEKRQEERAKLCADTVKCSGLVGFLYLELIDASFSLDGVLGAFALSKDILIITIGLFIGAMFVRSLTIMLVEKKTLKQFLYLEHGAHWAIGVLATLMFISTFHHVPEVVTGLLGLGFIVSALISSLVHNKRNGSEN